MAKFHISVLQHFKESNQRREIFIRNAFPVQKWNIHFVDKLCSEHYLFLNFQQQCILDKEFTFCLVSKEMETKFLRVDDRFGSAMSFSTKCFFMLLLKSTWTHRQSQYLLTKNKPDAE